MTLHRHPPGFRRPGAATAWTLAAGLLLAALPLQAQDREEARRFVLENTTITQLSCERGQSVYAHDVPGAIGEYLGAAYAVDPRQMEMRNRVLHCISGACVSEAGQLCRANELSRERCIARAESDLQRGQGVDKTSWASFQLTGASPERVMRAWDFFVKACGGANRSSF